MPPKRISARGIVIHENKILLIHRKSKGKEYYSFPGGGIEKGETSREACEREVFEETSIRVKVGDSLYIISHNDNSEHHMYICEYISGQPKLSLNAPENDKMLNNDEWYNPEWISVKSLSDIPLQPLKLRNILIRDLENGFPKKTESMFI